MKLRILIFIFALGILSGIVQLINNKYSFSKTETYFESILFFLIVGLTMLVCERSGVNDKKAHLVFGIILIFAGIFFDLVTT
ncbi:hypothetical protein [Paenibacillus sp. NFR01]|uniref:hypothetical protein n=1 Tax=Paenibacillus sp. NFR01 TaxID=1566279 RepID=UPI0008BA17F4|nr:hypothetical protein [Paenibacillus sp. NFR01]SET94247.1 hypothetical protein SAMN03159358_2789 [Paenibacillus sp. NFR01]